MSTMQTANAVRRSQEAYWRDLPQLVQSLSASPQWVAYAGDTRIGVGATQAELVRECQRRGLNVDEIYVARIRPRDLPPWEAERIVIPALEVVDQSAASE